MTHFFAMGGYAAFVWPAYAITFVAIAAAIFLTLGAYARAKSAVAELGDSETK